MAKNVTARLISLVENFCWNLQLKGDNDDEVGLKEEDENEHGEILCGTCGNNYKSDKFLIGLLLVEKNVTAVLYNDNGQEISLVENFSWNLQLKDDNDDEVGLEEENEDEHGETLCGTCGDNYKSNEFWIGCDICEKWFHGKCVKITPVMADRMKQYKCPACSNERAQPHLNQQARARI